ncbi:MAG: sugar ABC transporter substrate-binding protein [Christensenellales bacterium]|jgi:ribose transport system substrate-binding protein
MKRHWRKALTLVLVLALLLTVVLTGCKKEAAKDPNALEFGLIIRTLSVPFFMNLYDGVQQAFEDYNAENGTKHNLTMLDSNTDLQKEMNNAEDMVSSGMDCVFFVSSDPQGSMQTIEILTNAKIPLVIIDSGANNSELADAFIKTDNVAAGRIQMEHLAEAMGGKGNLIVFEDSTNANSRDRVDGRNEVLAKYPDIEIIDTHDGKNSVDAALEVFNNFMQSHAGEIDAVWTFSDTAAQGVIAALEGTAMQKDVLVSGINGDPTAKQFIKEGKMLGSSAQFPFELGYDGVNLGFRIMKGEKLEQQLFLMEPKWIDASNIDEYLEQ